MTKSFECYNCKKEINYTEYQKWIGFCWNCKNRLLKNIRIKQQLQELKSKNKK
jgi:hypothetical protein